MIYKASDCGIYNCSEPPTTVWLAARSDSDAGERLRALLALTWQVEPALVLVGSVVPVWEIEHNSIQDGAAGSRRWFEHGSCGDRPLYYQEPTLVFLASGDRQLLAKAARAAKMHAQELADLSAIEATVMSDARRAESIRYDAERYRAFATAPWLSEAFA